MEEKTTRNHLLHSPTVDHDDLAGEEATVGAGEEGNDASDVHRPRDPPKRTDLGQRLLQLIHGRRPVRPGGIMPGVLGEHVGVDAPGGDGVDGDVPVAAVLGEGSGEALDRALGPGVEGVVRDAGHRRGHRAHEDDAAAVSDVAVRVLGHEELGPGVDVEGPVVDLFRHVEFWVEGFDAGVVDDDVEVAEVVEGFREEAGDLADFAHVRLDGDGLATFGFDGRYDRLRRAGALGIVDRDGAASAGQLEGESGTYTSACTSDEGDLPVEA